jgi:hypothetical protein
VACVAWVAGMRHAFGKPQGRVARVEIGQVLLSVRCKDNHAHVAAEALRRAKFKFPGRQKVGALSPCVAPLEACPSRVARRGEMGWGCSAFELAIWQAIFHSRCWPFSEGCRGGHQVLRSTKWGFTQFERKEYEERRKDGSAVIDGNNVKYISDHGSIEKWMRTPSCLIWALSDKPAIKEDVEA